jgi:hypothetical protein
MQFWSRPDYWNFGLIRFEQSENSKLLSLVQIQSQKTSNTTLVVYFLNFPVITHTLKSKKTDKKLWSLEHNAQVEEQWIQILISTDDDITKPSWQNLMQNQEKCAIQKW